MQCNVQVNEAFAVVPMAWAKALGADDAKLNANGGACALGHPLGATGAKVVTAFPRTVYSWSCLENRAP